MASRQTTLGSTETGNLSDAGGAASPEWKT